MNMTRKLMADPFAGRLHNQYTNGLISYERYRRLMEERAAELAAESRGQTRNRLVRTAMGLIKDGEDQEEVVLVVMNDDAVQRRFADLDDAHEWARGVVSFCEWSLGRRDYY